MKMILALVGSASCAWADDLDRSSLAEINADSIARTSALGRQVEPDVRIGGLFQFRYTANIRDAEGTEESLTQGFGVQYGQITVDADLTDVTSVHVQGDFSLSATNFILDDAWADWKLDEAWTLRAGQFEAPFTRERLLHDGRLLAADRSVVSSVFSINRTQGVQALYHADDLRGQISWNDGASTLNGDFNSPNDADYAFTGRAEWRLAGEWSQFDDFSGWRGQKSAGMIGAAFHYQDGGHTGTGNSGTTADMSILALTADLSLEGNGWSLFASANWQSNDAPGMNATDNFGALIQGGIFATDSDEFFARYDVVIPDQDTPGGDDLFNAITVGWNHYFIPESHASKVTVDVIFYPDATTTNGLVNPDNSLGLLPSDNAQFAIQAQYSAAF